MKVVYLPHPDAVEPRYGDFVEAVDVDVEIVLSDLASFERHVAGATVVVEDGGLVANAAAIEAGARAGLALWQVTTTGVDHVDVTRFHELGLPLAHVPGRFTAPAVAEHAIFLMLALARQLNTAFANLRSATFYEPSGEEIAGKTVGIVGFGATGRELATRCRALGLDVIAVEVDARQAEEGSRLTGVAVGGLETLPSLLADADFVSVHVPLLESTRGLIGEAELAAMKRTAFLVNTARGEIVDEEALCRALVEGEIAGAGLDVFSTEPIDPAHPLLQLESVIATPHVAGITRGTSRRHGGVAAENVARVHAGEPPTYLV